MNTAVRIARRNMIIAYPSLVSMSSWTGQFVYQGYLPYMDASEITVLYGVADEIVDLNCLHDEHAVTFVVDNGGSNTASTVTYTEKSYKDFVQRALAVIGIVALECHQRGTDLMQTLVELWLVRRAAYINDMTEETVAYFVEASLMLFQALGREDTTKVRPGDLISALLQDAKIHIKWVPGKLCRGLDVHASKTLN